MKSLLKRIFLHHWPRKAVALLVAVVIWALVNHTITVTRTISNVPVRVLNVPPEKTVEGMLSDGLLSRRLSLTLTGGRNVVGRIRPDDIEVVTDAAGKGDQWTIQVTKRNLRSPDNRVDIGGISEVSPVDLTVQLSPVVTATVPVQIAAPIGEPPAGYRYLDVWPQRLTQKVSGPEKQVEELKGKGLRLTFDLSKITKEELEAHAAGGNQSDEVRFFVPDSWKRVAVPFGKEETEALNDPEAAFLHITFLKQELVPLGTPLPVDVFYPLRYSAELNPETHPLLEEGPIRARDGVDYLDLSVSVGNVSRLFLDTVRGSLRITFKAPSLDWSMQVVGPRQLEEQYVRMLLANLSPEEAGKGSPQLREEYLRSRFRKYVTDLSLYTDKKKPLQLTGEVTDKGIVIREDRDSKK